MRVWIAGAALFALTGWAQAQDLPAGYWRLEQTRPIVAKAGTLRLAPDLSGLTAGERTAVGKLIEVGHIFQRLYELQRHPQSLTALAELEALDRRLGSPEATRNLLAIYRINSGPIANTPNNDRGVFLPIDPIQPGANVYPWRIAKAEVEAWLAAHPEDHDAILGLRTVVRRADADSLKRDLAALAKHPALDTLHPGLKAGLERRLAAPDAKALYAVPYAVAYADEMIASHRLLNEAADAIQNDDIEFAGYLRARSRDLLTNDYEAGDAAWVTGRFKTLNAQIGAYETYDDELFGVKAFFAFSLLKTRVDETAAAREAMRALQALEDSLPYAAHKAVRSDTPAGVYDTIADFGEARGVNTASILPNEPAHSRRYGRIILVRASILGSTQILDNYLPAWRAVVAPQHAGLFTQHGRLNQTLWHEVGHYLGVEKTKGGRTLDVALQENHNLIEEMKSDLVSMYVAQALHRSGYHNDAQLRETYALGISRSLTEYRPRRDQMYDTMQLMQFNYFREHGVIAFDAASGTLTIDFAKMHDTVKALLALVLDVQYQGDKAASDRFIDRYTMWDEAVHGVLAKKQTDATRFRMWRIEYSALKP